LGKNDTSHSDKEEGIKKVTRRVGLLVASEQEIEGYGIIRMRASMQTAIYFLFVTVCPEMHLLYAGDIAALASLISILFPCSRSYQQSHAVGFTVFLYFLPSLRTVVG